MQLSHDLPCRLARLCFVVMMIAAWSGMPQCSAAGQAPAGDAKDPADARARAKDRAERCFRVVQAIERGIPRDTFDVSAVAAAVGKDPGAILKWVQDHTAWVPYRGMLRGPAGVLMDRRGNSLDRAALLAELLRASGGTVRLAHATLSDEAAQQLSKMVRFTPQIPLPPPPALDPGFVDKLVKDYADPYGLDPATLRRDTQDLLTRSQRATEDIADRTIRQTSTLSSLIGAPAAAHPDNGAQARAALAPAVLEALRDHWWVQVGTGDKWTDLDADFPAAGGGSPPPRSAQSVDWQPKDGHWPLDPALCHEIELRVVTEKWEDGRLSEQTPLQQSLRPAELIGQFIAVSFSPMNWPADLDLSREADPAAKVKSLASEQHEWLPLLRVGQQFYHQGSISDTGAVNPKPDLDAMKKAGKSVAGAGDAVLRAFGGLDAPEPPPQRGLLTAAWLEYEIRSPGSPPRKIRRQVFDLIGPAARAGQGAIPQPAIDASARWNRGLSLLGQIEVLPLVCQLSSAFVENLTARAAVDMHDSLMKLYSAESDKAARDAGQALLALTPLPSRLYDVALTRHTLNPHREDIYLDQPDILSLHQVLRIGDRGELVFAVGTDIVTNRVAVRPDLPAETARQARVTQGVLDTSAEALLDTADKRTPNASDLLAAQPRPQDWMVVRDRNDPDWRNANVSRDARARVDADLANGFIAIVPRHGAAAGKATTDWWRVDPNSGEALGFNDQGWGTDLGEYVFLFWVSFAACLVAQNTKAEGSAQRQVAGCALVALGSVVLAPEVLTLRYFVGSMVAGAGAGSL